LQQPDGLVDHIGRMKIANLTMEPSPTGPIVHVRGEIDLSNSEALRANILDLVPDDREGMVLDLTQTSYLDSSGVRLLFDIAQRLQSRHQRLVLVVSQEALIRRVVVLTKLDDVVPLVATVDEGVAALNGN
jgi:anti-anti-sigma factor